MSATPLNIVILAAGKGTRMYSKMPKVLHRIGGKPMVERVIDTAAALHPQNICVVIGHGKDQVLDTVKRDVVWVEQTEEAINNERTKRNNILSAYAKTNDVIHQLIDLALLQNGMLKGAALNAFLKRSISLIK